MKKTLQIRYNKYFFEMQGVDIDIDDSGKYIIDFTQADLDVLRLRLYELEKQSSIYLPNSSPFLDYNY